MAVHYALKCYGNSRIRLAIFMNQINHFRSYQKGAMPKQFSDILDYCFDKSQLDLRRHQYVLYQDLVKYEGFS